MQRKDEVFVVMIVLKRAMMCLGMICLLLGQQAVAEDQASTNVVPLLDLRDQSWGNGEIYTLDGVWLFRWQTLLTPADWDSVLADHQSVKFQVPGLWNDGAVPGRDFPVEGHGSFRVRVLVPEARQLYLALPDMPSAYKLWINGELLAQNGVVGASENEEVPAFKVKSVSFRAPDGVMDIALQVSNYHYKEGGIWHSFRLTDQSGHAALIEKPLVLEAIIFTLLIGIGLYQISIFYLRRQETASFYFGAFCLLLGLRAMITGHRVFPAFDWLGWSALQRIEHFTFFLSLPLFTAFFRCLYPNEVSQKLVRTSAVGGAGFALMTLIAPVSFFAKLAFPFQFFILFVMYWVAVGLWRACQARRKGSRLLGTGMIVFAVAVIHDILLAHFLVSGMPWTPYAFLGFVIAQAVLLNRRYVNSLSLVEGMSAALKMRNEELEKLDAFKDEFLATTSHELKMPLHGILGLVRNLQVTASGKLDQAERRNLDLIIATADRLNHLVEDILDYSALKHGKLDMHVESTNLHFIVKSVLDTVEPLVGEKDIAISMELAPGTACVQADPNRLQQILFNLIGNAIKFTEEGQIRVSAQRSGAQVEIVVEDTGVGIPVDKQGEVFDPFLRLGSRSTSAYTGTGLGLYITQRLVELQGGSIQLRSEPGRGTEVRVVLPAGASSDAQPVIAEPLVTPRLSPRSGETGGEAMPESGTPLVYVVDDEETNRQLLKAQLSRQGWRVEVFAGGGSLLRRLADQLPDVIVLDLMMPGMNGFDVCQEIRQQYSAFALPVIMLTARHQNADIVRALSVGANDYLTKPYHENELIARISNMLAVRRQALTEQENERLSQEIEARIKKENELKAAYERLVALVEQSSEPLCLVNASLELVYSNKAFRSEVIQRVWESAARSPLEKWLAEASTEAETVIEIPPAEQQTLPASAMFVRKIVESGSPCVAVAIVPANQLSAPLSIIETLSGELAANRARIESLENALQCVAHLLNNAPAEKGGVANPEKEARAEVPEHPSGPSVSPEAAENQARLALVRLMRLSLDLWERYARKGKVELAEESRCWRVYLDGGTMKTRTLDKYLTERSLPEKPRWRSVVRTANFVLSSCHMRPEDEEKLTQLLDEVQKIYS